MENEILVQISQKIKSIRKDKNLTIQEIAERAGVTKGLISQIENSRTLPSLLVLMQIIKALEVDLNFFFNDLSLDGREAPVLVLRKEEYSKFEKEPASGYQYERIFTRKIKSGAVDFVLLEILPGSVRNFVTTDAFEFKYILQGTVKYIFRDQTVELFEGDSMLFDGRLEHNPVNEGKEIVRMLVVYFFENME
ncbi:helix-turn-helix domain-containing protein [Aquiflexum gelatinilyticum]|uniref:XRE family transcriptional regulator n=1 Tax=Aquiflexum gelatinilyticum TaxID=2961943 RepID=A0A9X2P9M8_9BACT|nr:XRE family transcriptional regulator [Aquiflexum gelatinilyticum]MCR9014650.1 XRE family transcriptional regulator [Aquiflexum gelatinilyticum]MCS4434358.1 XRE family transcriptional regulator [Aquiflexum gelatinilyticum]